VNFQNRNSTYHFPKTKNKKTTATWWEYYKTNNAGSLDKPNWINNQKGLTRDEHATPLVNEEMKEAKNAHSAQWQVTTTY